MNAHDVTTLTLDDLLTRPLPSGSLQHELIGAVRLAAESRADALTQPQQQNRYAAAMLALILISARALGTTRQNHPALKRARFKRLAELTGEYRAQPAELNALGALELALQAYSTLPTSEHTPPHVWLRLIASATTSGVQHRDTPWHIMLAD